MSPNQTNAIQTNRSRAPPETRRPIQKVIGIDAASTTRVEVKTVRHGPESAVSRTSRAQT